ncbi:MAG: 2-amino-4-hydroxy-6-hydroxymethyldihydropteridine diphosphokinase [Desulfobacteraceae bacterium]|jgi:2-amino-4-hydroxy-6-hydroxymethyldihydropteridine diphosphokinase
MSRHLAYISIGSNMGDPLQNCCNGIQQLCHDGTVEMVAKSPFYRTEPVDYLEQEWFLNAALQVRTALSPHDLLSKTQGVEKAVGRKSGGVRFGPRILDLDIIFYDDLILDTQRLVIPHPRMDKRRFVLQPICDIDPDVTHPGLGQTVQELLNQLVIDEQGMKPCSFDC